MTLAIRAIPPDRRLDRRRRCARRRCARPRRRGVGGPAPSVVAIVRRRGRLSDLAAGAPPGR